MTYTALQVEEKNMLGHKEQYIQGKRQINVFLKQSVAKLNWTAALWILMTSFSSLILFFFLRAMCHHATFGDIHGGVVWGKKSHAVQGPGARRCRDRKDQQHQRIRLLSHSPLHSGRTEERHWRSGVVGWSSKNIYQQFILRVLKMHEFKSS